MKALLRFYAQLLLDATHPRGVGTMEQVGQFLIAVMLWTPLALPMGIPLLVQCYAAMFTVQLWNYTVWHQDQIWLENHLVAYERHLAEQTRWRDEEVALIDAVNETMADTIRELGDGGR